jgi:hypothetical protein
MVVAATINTQSTATIFQLLLIFVLLLPYIVLYSLLESLTQLGICEESAVLQFDSESTD